MLRTAEGPGAIPGGPGPRSPGVCGKPVRLGVVRAVVGPAALALPGDAVDRAAALAAVVGAAAVAAVALALLVGAGLRRGGLVDRVAHVARGIVGALLGLGGHRSSEGGDGGGREEGLGEAILHRDLRCLGGCCGEIRMRLARSRSQEDVGPARWSAVRR